MFACPSRRHGLTLVEFLCVAAIVGMLFAILFPSLSASRESSRKLLCESRLAELAMGIQQYEVTHNAYPAATLGTKSVVLFSELNDATSARYWGRGQHTSWIVQVAPFCEMDFWPDAPKIATDHRRLLEPPTFVWDLPGFSFAAAQKIPALTCPSSALVVDSPIPAYGAVQPIYGENPNGIPYGFDWKNFRDRTGLEFGQSNYIASVGSTGDGADYFQVFSGFLAVRYRRRVAEVVDGLSHTICVGETLGSVAANRQVGYQSCLVGGIGSGAVKDGVARLGNTEQSHLVGFGATHLDVAFAYADGHVGRISREILASIFLSAFRVNDQFHQSRSKP